MLKKAAKEPQLIHNRTELVAVVVGAADAIAFLEWRGRRKAPLAGCGIAVVNPFDR